MEVPKVGSSFLRLIQGGRVYRKYGLQAGVIHISLLQRKFRDNIQVRPKRPKIDEISHESARYLEIILGTQGRGPVQKLLVKWMLH